MMATNDEKTLLSQALIVGNETDYWAGLDPGKLKDIRSLLQDCRSFPNPFKEIIDLFD